MFLMIGMILFVTLVYFYYQSGDKRYNSDGIGKIVKLFQFITLSAKPATQIPRQKYVDILDVFIKNLNTDQDDIIGSSEHIKEQIFKRMTKNNDYALFNKISSFMIDIANGSGVFHSLKIPFYVVAIIFYIVKSGVWNTNELIMKISLSATLCTLVCLPDAGTSNLREKSLHYKLIRCHAKNPFLGVNACPMLNLWSKIMLPKIFNTDPIPLVMGGNVIKYIDHVHAKFSFPVKRISFCFGLSMAIGCMMMMMMMMMMSYVSYLYLTINTCSTLTFMGFVKSEINNFLEWPFFSSSLVFQIPVIENQMDSTCPTVWRNLSFTYDEPTLETCMNSNCLDVYHNKSTQKYLWCAIRFSTTMPPCDMSLFQLDKKAYEIDPRFLGNNGHSIAMRLLTNLTQDGLMLMTSGKYFTPFHSAATRTHHLLLRGKKIWCFLHSQARSILHINGFTDVPIYSTMDILDLYKNHPFHCITQNVNDMIYLPPFVYHSVYSYENTIALTTHHTNNPIHAARSRLFDFFYSYSKHMTFISDSFRESQVERFSTYLLEKVTQKNFIS